MGQTLRWVGSDELAGIESSAAMGVVCFREDGSWWGFVGRVNTTLAHSLTTAYRLREFKLNCNP